ncbi:MAG TPA: HAMP domain-containing sensor histidine kinase, partial [Nitriliruptorales bacterium]
VTGEVEVERMKTEFLSNISHELRTPLTPIKGYAEVLRVKELSHERVTDFAGNIAESAQRLERIIAMLVDFAALEAGRMEVKLAPTPVGPEVDLVLDRWRQRLPQRRFTRRLERGLPPVQVDPDLLDRVLEELVDNAVKFSESPVRIRGRDEGDGRVRLTVHDTGSGIEEDELVTILRDFHQADGSATRRYGGLGLGMSIVQRIVERFNGEVLIESDFGEGTDVHLLLPVAEQGRS